MCSTASAQQPAAGSYEGTAVPITASVRGRARSCTPGARFTLVRRGPGFAWWLQPKQRHPTPSATAMPVYLDAKYALYPQWTVLGALRAEDYSDFGAP